MSDKSEKLLSTTSSLLDAVEKPRKKARKAKNPRSLSAVAGDKASNLKNATSDGLDELHRNIRRATLGNHELIASATRAESANTQGGGGGGGDGGGGGVELTPEDQARSRELTRIIYEGGLKSMGIEQHNIENCCQAHSHFALPQTDEERDALSRKLAKKPLLELTFDVVQKMRRENPSISKDEAAEQLTACVDEELHRLQHVFYLTHGVPGVDTLEQRFKAWLGVRPGITQNELEAELRAQNPDELPSRISARARLELAAIDKNKTTAFQTHISDDKIQHMLLRAYRNGDLAARDIYVDFRKRQIALQSKNPDEVARRIDEMLIDLNTHVERAKLESNKAQVLADADVVQQQVAKSTMNLPASLGVENPVGAEGVAVEPGVRSGPDFLRAYTKDLSATPGELRAQHCAAMVDSVMSSINLMATLQSVAPPDALFDADDRLEGDAIDNLYEQLRDGMRLSAETLHQYIDQWQRVQAESQSDIDRELVRAHRHEEREAIEKQMAKQGVSHEQVASDLAFGVAPEMSRIYRGILEVSEKQRFALAQREALEASKFVQKIEQQATTMARDMNRESGAAKAVSKDDAIKMIMEKAARSLPLTRRRYRANFLREAAGPQFLERPCVRGEECVVRAKRRQFPGQSHTRSGGSRVANNGFICREFLLPAQQAEVDATGKLPTTIRMCLPCNILTTSKLATSYAEQKEGCEERMPFQLLQDHRIAIDEPGEYSRECCLPMTYANNRPTGVEAPFQSYNDGNWVSSWTDVHGQRLRCLVETDTSVFRLPSSSETAT